MQQTSATAAHPPQQLSCCIDIASTAMGRALLGVHPPRPGVCISVSLMSLQVGWHCCSAATADCGRLLGIKQCYACVAHRF
jgi:hypothetical protein